MLNIRQAIEGEGGILTDIAAASEAYWGYDEAFMENFKVIYKVTDEFMKNNPTFVLEDEDRIAGFYSIIKNDMEYSLEYFYVLPQNIGKGFGKAMWKHLTEYCRREGITRIDFVTSPQAKEFYIKMGAKLTGETDSLVIKNRRIPVLTYTLE